MNTDIEINKYKIINHNTASRWSSSSSLTEFFAVLFIFGIFSDYFEIVRFKVFNLVLNQWNVINKDCRAVTGWRKLKKSTQKLKTLQNFKITSKID